MARRLSFVCEEDLLERIDVLAREYDLSRQEALRQAVEVGLETIEDDRSRRNLP
jgi:metal-responsive CopG/Arc/MetJ family transcriptional regulator